MPVLAHLCGPENASSGVTFTPAQLAFLALPYVLLPFRWLGLFVCLIFFLFSFESFISGTLKEGNYDRQVVVFLWKATESLGGSGSLRVGLET